MAGSAIRFIFMASFHKAVDYGVHLQHEQVEKSSNYSKLLFLGFIWNFLLTELHRRHFGWESTSQEDDTILVTFRNCM